MAALPEDVRAIARVRVHGDRAAFGELVRRYQSPVRAFLRRLVGGDDALADDLAQETFLLAFRHLDAFRGDAAFRTWLCRIAYNAFRMDRRQVRSRREEPVSESAAEPAGPAPEARALLLHDLDRAMRTLPEAEAAALYLAYAEGLAHPEIALVLDCPLGTVKTHIHRGRERLRQRMDGWEAEVRHGDA